MKSNKSCKAIRYRIYPNRKQEALINRTFGCVRFVHNHMLTESIKSYEQGESITSAFAFNYLLPSLKNKFLWLKEVDATALTAADDDLADAFSRFFKKQNGFPKYKRKHHARRSYTSKCVNNNIRIEAKYIRLPKVGLVKARIHRLPKKDWILKSATVTMEADGKYYASVLFSFEQSIQPVSADVNTAIGLDYKSDGLYMDSDGNCADMPKYYRKAQKALARQQRKLSRKQHGSSNYNKQKRKAARIHSHVANQRRDYLHKKSTEIANLHDIVCVESLNMKALSNSGFHNGKATLDNGYGMFLDMLSYKLFGRGKVLVNVDKWYPSSQICSSCGYIHKLALSERTYICPSCGAVIDRDVNAAINIKNEGIRLYLSA